MNSIKNLAAKAVQTREAWTPDNLPIICGLWYIAVAPVVPPKASEGGIEYAEESKKAEETLVSVGKVMAMGPFAYKSKTPSGLDLSQDPGKPVVGNFVLFQQYAGQQVVMRDGRRLILLTDTEIYGVIPDAFVSQIRFYL